MPKCDKCSQSVSRYDDSIICTAPLCAQSFHTKCVKISEELLVDLKTTGKVKTWRCDMCEKPPQSAVQKKTALIEQIAVSINNDSLKNIEDITTSKIKQAINSITEEVINVLRAEINMLHSNNCNFSEEIAKLRSEISKLQLENCDLKNEITNLKINSSLAIGDKSVLKDEVNSRSSKTDTKTTNRIKIPEMHSPKNYAQKNTNNTGLNAKKKYTEVLKNNNISNSTYLDFTPHENINSSEEAGFQVVRPRRKTSNKNKTITGSATNSNIKAITKYSYLYVTRLEKDVTSENIINYLKELEFNDVICDKMNSKRPDIYSSFRIGVPAPILDKLKDCKIWPVGTYVNTFFWKMKPRTDTT